MACECCGKKFTAEVTEEPREHRLLCANSTHADDVARLMAGEKAILCATDPPYLVDYTGDRPDDSGKDWSATYREIDIEDAYAFFSAVFKNVLEVIAPHAAIYCWHAHKRCGEIQKVWAEPTEPNLPPRA
jgi:DNA modification methylase